jgi:PDZ domain
VEEIPVRHLLLVGLPLALCLLAALCLADPPTPSSGESDRNAPEIAEWIRQLGDTSFAVREAASKRLMEREDAAPALRRALKSPDPEVARRADDILNEHARRREQRALARLAELANNGQVDQAAELLVRRPQWADEEAAWQVMTTLAERLIDLGEKEFGKPAVPVRRESLPAGDYHRYAAKTRPKVQATGRVAPDVHEPASFVVRASEIEVVGTTADDLFASAGAVRSKGMVIWAVIFAGGPVEVRELNHSIVVCDGDFTATSGAHDSLIIARGDVRCADCGLNCRIVTSGKVFLDRSASYPEVKLKESKPKPLGFVQFFDPASVGITVEGAEGGVRIREAAEGKPFAKAGLQAGDLAVVADDTPLDSPDTFRRLLRKKLATGGDLTLEVRRENTSWGVVVPFQE